MRKALSLIDDGNPNGIALLESQLLGLLMLDPVSRLEPCLQTLRPADFESAHRGIAFGAIMLERRPELGMVVTRLEREGHRPPGNRTGWGDALARCLDVAMVDEEAIPDAVRAIREASRRRQLSAIMGGPDGAGAD